MNHFSAVAVVTSVQGPAQRVAGALLWRRGGGPVLKSTYAGTGSTAWVDLHLAARAVGLLGTDPGSLLLRTDSRYLGDWLVLGRPGRPSSPTRAALADLRSAASPVLGRLWVEELAGFLDHRDPGLRAAREAAARTLSAHAEEHGEADVADLGPGAGRVSVVVEPGSVEMGKLCPGCGTWVAWAGYHKNARGPRGLMTRCKGCVCAARNLHTGRNRALVRAQVKRSYLCRERGLTLEQHDALHAAAAGRCVACGGPESEVGALVLDHCHVTGRSRGFLCNGCNTGLGCFAEDPERMARAATWLREQHVIDGVRGRVRVREPVVRKTPKGKGLGRGSRPGEWRRKGVPVTAE